MKKHIHILSAIPVAFPEKEVFLRLGGHLTKTVYDREKYRLTALQAYELCQLRGRWVVLDARAGSNGIILADGRLLPGKDFAVRCAGISAVWCGAVTAGREIINFRDSRESMAESAVCDAVGSECADAAMDFLQKQAGRELARCGLRLAEKRYSPGYGDMPLAMQKFFYDVLELETLDMELTGNDFLIPEKSVTAFAGVI